MGFDLSALRSDRNLQNDGNWVKDVLPGLDIKVRSTGSMIFKKRMAECLKPFNKLGKEPTIEQQEDISRRVVAETILLDWKGVVLDGEELEFTQENALRLFEEIPDFLVAVSQSAGNLETFKEKKDLDTAGNSNAT